MMTIDKTEFSIRNTHRFKKPILKLLAALVCAALLLWSWNTLAVDLFGLPSAQFRHAIAAIAAISCVAFAFESARKTIV